MGRNIIEKKKEKKKLREAINNLYSTIATLKDGYNVKSPLIIGKTRSCSN